MTAISIPRVKSPSFFLEPSAQATLADKKILEERTISYNAFLNTFENLEEQTKKKIEELKEYPKQETQEQQDHLEKSLVEQNELLAQLQNEEEKKISNFILANHKNIFKVDQKKIKELNELDKENFSRFLVSVYKKIRAKSLADGKSLKEDEIREIVDKCVNKIRATEAWDSFKKFLGWPFGVKIDPKNFFSSLKDGLLEKVPFLGKKKEEEKEKRPLNDEEMVTKFLRTIFLPIFLSFLSMSIFGAGTFTIVIAVIGAIWAFKSGVEVLVSSDKECTSDNPVKSFSSHDRHIVRDAALEQKQQKQKEAKEQAEECDKRFSKDISNIILKTEVKRTEKSGQSVSPLKEAAAVNQPTKANPAPTNQDFWQGLEDKRRENNTEAGQTLFNR